MNKYDNSRKRQQLLLGACWLLLLALVVLWFRPPGNNFTVYKSVYMVHPSEYHDDHHAKLSMADPCTTNVDLHDVPLVPRMTNGEQALFKKHLHTAKYYFETGSGGSTYYAALAENLMRIDVVESDFTWLQTLRTSVPVNKAECTKRLLHFHYVDINANTSLGGFGVPKDRGLQSMWALYAGAIALHAGSPWKPKPDLVFVDARFRVACASHAYRVVPDNATIIIHDYNRQEYHIVEQLLDKIEQQDTLAVFKLKPRTPDRLTLAEQLIQQHTEKLA